MNKIMAWILCLALLFSQITVFAHVQYFHDDRAVDQLYRLHEGTVRVLAEIDSTEAYDVVCALYQDGKVIAARVFSGEDFASGQPQELFVFEENTDFENCSISTFSWNKVGMMIPVDEIGVIGGSALYQKPVMESLIYDDPVESNERFYAAFEPIGGPSVQSVQNGKAIVEWNLGVCPTSFQFKGELINALYTFDYQIVNPDGIHSAIVLRQNRDAGGRYNDSATEFGGGIAFYPMNSTLGGMVLSIGREEYDRPGCRQDVKLSVPVSADFIGGSHFEIYDLDDKILYFINNEPVAAVIFDELTGNVYSSGTVYDAYGNAVLHFDNTTVKRSSRIAFTNRAQTIALDNFKFYGDFSNVYKTNEHPTLIYEESFAGYSSQDVLKEWMPICGNQSSAPIEDNALIIRWKPGTENPAYQFTTPFSDVTYQANVRFSGTSGHAGFNLRTDDNNAGNLYGHPTAEGFFGVGILPVGFSDTNKAEVVIATRVADQVSRFFFPVELPEGVDVTQYNTYTICDTKDRISVFIGDKPLACVIFSETNNNLCSGGVVLDGNGDSRGTFFGALSDSGTFGFIERSNSAFMRDFKIYSDKTANVPSCSDQLLYENYSEMTQDALYSFWDPVVGTKKPTPIENSEFCINWNPAAHNVAYQRKTAMQNVKYEMNFRVLGTGLQSLIGLRTMDSAGLLFNDIQTEKSKGLAFMPTISLKPGYSAIAVSNHTFTNYKDKHLIYIPWTEGRDFTTNTKLSVYDFDDRILICVDDVLFATVYLFNHNGEYYTAGSVTDGNGKPLGVFRNTVLANSKLCLSVRADVMYVSDFTISSERNDNSMLVHDGVTDYRIVHAKDASAAVRHAAEELASYMMKITGATFPIITDDTDETDKEILIGATSRIGAENMPELKEDGFIIERVGSKLWITGNGDRGVLYGVYGYLEALGCRFFAEDTETIPKLSDIRLAQVNHVKEEPAFYYRDLYWTCTYDADFAVKSRINGNVFSCDRNLDEAHGKGIDYVGSFCHTFYQLVPPDKYFASHPEYYSEKNGVRTCENLYTQLCLTNEDVLNIVIAEARKWLDANPGVPIISISQNDSFVFDSFCQCAKCTAVNNEEGAHSGTLIRFVNRVAEALDQSHPGILVDTLAYQYSVGAPKITKPRENVCVRYCTGVCAAHPIEECSNATGVVGNLREWGRICNKMYIWEYTTNFAHYLTPFPNFKTLQKNIQFFKENGADGLFLQGMYQDMSKSGEFGELRSYLLTRLAWDPYCDLEKAQNEFMRAYYGEGADEVEYFLDFIHTAIGKDNRHFNLITAPKDLFNGLISDVDISTLNATWARAKAETVNDPKAQEHIRRSELCWRYYKMNAGRGEFAGNNTAATNQFYADCNSLGVTRMNEGANVPWV